MKKKIKDLTMKEAEKICGNSTGCDICPLDVPSCSYCMKNVIENKELLEKEVEVEG